MCSTSCLLLLLYTAILVHIRLGSSYKQLSYLIGLLFVSNIGTLLIVYSNYKLFSKDQCTLGFVWMLALGYSIQDGFFGVSHHILAAQYTKMATEIPLKLQHMKVSKEYKRSQRRLFWILLVMNILFPVLEAVVLVPFNA